MYKARQPDYQMWKAPKGKGFCFVIAATGALARDSCYHVKAISPERKKGRASREAESARRFSKALMSSLILIPSAALSLAAPAATSLAPRRALPPQMTTMFNGRGFFIRAAAVGNAGFDPLGISTADTLVPLRHAEIKHGRLAMLAAISIPIQEMWHPALARIAGAPDVLASTNGLSPTVINGGLFSHPELAPAIACGATMMAAVEVIDITRRAKEGLKFNEYHPDSVAGDVQFDPLRLATDLPATERFELQEAEMLNGRVAMVALISFVLYESMMGSPIIHTF